MNKEDFKNKVKGRFFKAKFIKKDGTIREMTARFGVKRYLKGVGLKYNPENNNNIIVFDVKLKEYRTINLDRLIYLKSGDIKLVGDYAILEALKWLIKF